MTQALACKMVSGTRGLQFPRAFRVSAPLRQDTWASLRFSCLVSRRCMPPRLRMSMLPTMLRQMLSSAASAPTTEDRDRKIQKRRLKKRKKRRTRLQRERLTSLCSLRLVRSPMCTQTLATTSARLTRLQRDRKRLTRLQKECNKSKATRDGLLFYPQAPSPSFSAVRETLVSPGRLSRRMARVTSVPPSPQLTHSVTLVHPRGHIM
jgi:hypothetical protein